MANQRNKDKSQISSWVHKKSKAKLVEESKKQKKSVADTLDGMIETWSYIDDVETLRAIAKREGISFETLMTKILKKIKEGNG